jgi:hypothetical protein
MGDMTEDHPETGGRLALALACIDDDQALLAVFVAMIFSRAVFFFAIFMA